MKKKFLGVIAVLILASMAATTVFAGAEDLSVSKHESAQSTYSGYINGDRGSKAPLTLALSVDADDDVIGTVYLDRGLYVDAGRCGGTYIPATIQTAEGEFNKYKPNLLEASTTIKVSGIKVSIDLEGTLSSNGDALKTEAKIDLPWLCGRDPVIQGTLYAQQLP